MPSYVRAGIRKCARIRALSRRVKYSTLCQLIFLMPKGMDEKKRIGAFFDRLDSLITLHQRKYCGVVSWMLGVALVRLGSESDGAFGEMEHVLR